jgi:hypothetical protein
MHLKMSEEMELMFKKIKVVKLIAVCVASFSILSISSNVVHANKGDVCGFGEILYGYDAASNALCTDNPWQVIVDNDGLYIVYTTGEFTDDMGNDYFIEVQCNARKLSVLVYTEPIGMYPDVNRRGVGTALVRIDGGKLKNFTYRRLKDSSGVSLVSTKALTSSMLKGKSKLFFKIPAPFYQVVDFSLFGFSSYQSAFKARGCSLK